jgi:hypothetical protein
MDIQVLNPLERADWDALLLDHPRSSFFHTSAWARVLAKSYRFEPLYLAGFDGTRLVLLMPMMGVRSLLTGKRGISLPFTDRCSSFAPSKGVFLLAQGRAVECGKARGWRYVEWRDDAYFDPDIPTWEEFYTHEIDLSRKEDAIFACLSDNNRRNIKKAVREGVSVRIDQTPEALRDFYKLNLLTRKRHGLPPQPFGFFRNVHEFVIAKGHGVIASAFYQGKAVASSVFFHFGGEAIFKYNASDLSFQHLRPNNLLMWEACLSYARQGFRSMNLGRTDPRDEGLLRFKRVWGAKEGLVGYHRYDIRMSAFVRKRPGSGTLYPKLFSRVPVSLARVIGRLAYRHAG